MVLYPLDATQSGRIGQQEAEKSPMIIRTKAYARAGLIGNPSDGYFGKTISIALSNYAAEVMCYETPVIRILPGPRDNPVFESLEKLADHIRLHGYYGGERLIRAAMKRFHDYCQEQGITLPARNPTFEYRSSIPSRVGLAGSSAIVTASFRALTEFYKVEIENPVLANLVLESETKELKIPAGLQDRVIQVYGGAVFMDFSKSLMEKQGYGNYEPIDPAALPPLFLAYHDSLSEGTEVFHDNIRERWQQGEEKVAGAMEEFAELTRKARELITAGRGAEIGPLMDRNFDVRASIFTLSEGNHELVRRAREVGASAKFAGSGGAVIGTYESDEMYRELEKTYKEMGAVVFQPQIV
jgi:glucuronokinase